MFKKVYRLNGDSKVLDNMLNGLRNRKLDQKFIYFGEGADYFYKYVYLNKLNKDKKIHRTGISLNPWKSILDKEKNNTEIEQVYIGMACGDSLREIEFLKSIGNKNIKYIGVDFSEEMLDLSEKNLKQEGIEYKLIRSDIYNPDLISQINILSKKNSQKSFLFLGGTFGNFNTTSITDLIGSYLKIGEKLYLDIVYKDEGLKSDFDIHNNYIQRIKDNDQDWNNHILGGFKYIDFPYDKGEILIHTSKDEQIGLFKVAFSLKILEDLEFFLINKSVVFGKGEEIDFFQVIYYEIEKLKKFMSLHHFRLKNFDTDNGILGQFIFEKE